MDEIFSGLFTGLFQALGEIFSWRLWLCLVLGIAGLALIDHEFGNRILKVAAFIAFGLPLCLLAVRWELAHQRRVERQRL